MLMGPGVPLKGVKKNSFVIYSLLHSYSYSPMEHSVSDLLLRFWVTATLPALPLVDGP